MYNQVGVSFYNNVWNQESNFKGGSMWKVLIVFAEKRAKLHVQIENDFMLQSFQILIPLLGLDRRTNGISDDLSRDNVMPIYCLIPFFLRTLSDTLNLILRLLCIDSAQGNNHKTYR